MRPINEKTLALKIAQGTYHDINSGISGDNKVGMAVVTLRARSFEKIEENS